MQPVDPGRRVAERCFGTAVGATGALAAGYGALWSGHVDGLLIVALVALLVGSTLGAITWGLFKESPEEASWWFVSLFGGVIGMLSGAFAGFPLGAIFGAGGGATGGPVAAMVWRASASPRSDLGMPPRAVLAGGVGALMGLCVALWMAS